MVKSSFLIAVFAILFLISGCSDSRSASESNFRESLDRYYEKKPFILELKYVKKFPAKYRKSSLNTSKFEYLDLFVETGLLNKSLLSEDKSLGFLGNKTINYVKYELTDRGAELFREKVRKRLLDYVSGFVAGTVEVDEIKFFTEPSTMAGKTVSEVKYSVKVDLYDEFGDSKELLNRSELLDSAIKNRLPLRKSVLVLTNTGWIHEKEI